MRNTPQKKIIMDALCAADHPTATELCEIVQAARPTVSRGTVFSVLSQFSENGEITKIFADGEARFDARREPHAHFVCERCGKIYDIFDGGACGALSLECADGHRVTSASLNYFGICKNCK